jgi:hypothetical protein
LESITDASLHVKHLKPTGAKIIIKQHDTNKLFTRWLWFSNYSDCFQLNRYEKKAFVF